MAMSGLSLSLFAAVVLLWVRSTGRYDYVKCSMKGKRAAYSASRWTAASSFDGRLDLIAGYFPLVVEEGPDGPFVVSDWQVERDTTEAVHVIDTHDSWERWRLSTYAGHFGFAYWRCARQNSESRGVTIPYWAVLLLLAIAPARALWRARRSRWRLRAGRCRTCGYDLRATHHRCPECGTAVATEATAASAASSSSPPR